MENQKELSQRKLLKSPPLMSIMQRASARSSGKRAAQRMKSLCRDFLSVLHAVCAFSDCWENLLNSMARRGEAGTWEGRHLIWYTNVKVAWSNKSTTAYFNTKLQAQKRTQRSLFNKHIEKEISKIKKSSLCLRNKIRPWIKLPSTQCWLRAGQTGGAITSMCRSALLPTCISLFCASYL